MFCLCGTTCGPRLPESVSWDEGCPMNQCLNSKEQCCLWLVCSCRCKPLAKSMVPLCKGNDTFLWPVPGRIGQMSALAGLLSLYLRTTRPLPGVHIKVQTNGTLPRGSEWQSSQVILCELKFQNIWSSEWKGWREETVPVTETGTYMKKIEHLYC